MSFCSRRHKDKTIPLAPCQAFSFDSDNSADSSNLSSSACMKTIHLNDTKPKCEELSSHKPQSDLVLLDIYSGCGGMSTGLCLGAKLSGLDLVTKWALDINKFACESLKLNHPETQIRNESAEDFLDLLKEWDKLCKRYAVKDVEGATKSNIKLLRASQNNLYSKTDEKIPSGEYEVASLIDICYGDPSDTGKRGLKFQVRWVGYGPSEDTWEPIEGLSKCEDRIQNFVLKGFKAKILPRPGANFRDLSGVVVGADNVARRDPTAEPILLPSGRPLVPDYALNFCEGKSTRPFGRLWWDETVPTVICRPDSHSQVALHPEQDRILTVRENARLQGFPDYYRFCGEIKERYCQIGNAVAIPVARALGYALGMAVQKLSRDEPLMTLPPKFSNSTTIQLLQSSTHGRLAMGKLRNNSSRIYLMIQPPNLLPVPGLARIS